MVTVGEQRSPPPLVHQIASPNEVFMNSGGVPPHTDGGVTSLLDPGSMRRQAEGQVELRAKLTHSARPRGGPAK